MSAVTFQLLATDGDARRGVVTTPHGSFETPAFMPVGTQGTVKGCTPEQVRATGAGCVLGNTYHLMLRPGADVVRELGGLQRFGGWCGPMLTDSGGFQVFSLSQLNKVDDDGVTFSSHINGDRIRMTPEVSMAVQNDLGADIIMAFDQFAAGDAPREQQETALRRTMAWIRRCVDSHQRPGEQALFGIVQGGVERDLRERCATAMVDLSLPGYAVGGLAVGEDFESRNNVLDWTCAILPQDRPRYMMGVGFPADIVHAVARGIDMFDCVVPTRDGRSGTAFHGQEGRIKLTNARFQRDEGPIEEGCDCVACATFSRGAVRHFMIAGEMLGPILLSLHNLRFYQRLMADVREAITAGRFADFLRDDPRCRIGGSKPRPTSTAATAL